ncbi:hypothetical protein C8C96_0969 [Acidovorax sp. 100]|nr:hypothetical protein C8C96_0969 [Acidovorax sp. 100]
MRFQEAVGFNFTAAPTTSNLKARTVEQLTQDDEVGLVDL